MSTAYDENLLASAPKATKAQMQDGYNPDILAENNSSTPATPAVDAEAQRIPTPVQQKSEEFLNLKKKVPFYATKKGIIVIIVLVLIIIAAVVGGAVGGTRKHHVDATSPNVPASSTITGGSGQGVATASVGSGQGVGSSPPPSSSSSSSPPSGSQGAGLAALL